jgi:hypothetical protein
MPSLLGLNLLFPLNVLSWPVPPHAPCSDRCGVGAGLLRPRWGHCGQRGLGADTLHPPPCTQPRLISDPYAELLKRLVPARVSQEGRGGTAAHSRFREQLFR